MKWNPKTRGRISKHTGSLTPAHRYTPREIQISTCALFLTHIHKDHINIPYQGMHTSTSTGIYLMPVGKAIVFRWELARASEHNDHRRNYCWLHSFSPTLSIYAEMLQN